MARRNFWFISARLILLLSLCSLARSLGGPSTGSEGVVTCNGQPMTTDEVCNHTETINGEQTGGTTYTYDEQAAY